jgi:hypothetical protein
MARGIALVVPILLAACAATTAPSPSSSPTGSIAPSVTLPASLTPSALPSIRASETYAIWRRVEMPDPLPHVYGGEWAADVIAYRGRYVAVGFINGGCCDGGFTTDTRAVVWSSADGTTWQLEPNAPAFALGHMVAAATDGRRIVAVGTRNVESTADPGLVELQRATWTSTDGAKWTAQFDDLPPFYSVAFLNGRFWAAVAYANTGPEIWSSANGISWTMDAGAEALGLGTVNVLRATSVGLVAAGFADGPDAPDGSHTSTAVSWLRHDTGKWLRSPDQAALRSSRIDDLATGDGRLVAVGANEAAEGGLAWVSDDGLTWARIDDPALAVDCAIPQLLVAVDGGLVATGAMGCSQAQFRAWTSLDGSHWSIVSANQPGLEGVELQVQGWLVRPDWSLLAVGYGWVADHGAPMAWLVVR